MKVAKVAKEIKKSVESHAHKFGSKSESGEGNQEKCKIACPELESKCVSGEGNQEKCKIACPET